MENEEINLDMEIDDEDTQDEGTQSEKPKESIESKKARLERQLSQINKKLGTGQEKKAEPSSEKEGLDRIDKVILRAEKITDSEEIDLVKDIMKETGKDIEDVLESRHFKAELKALREDKQAQDALPSSKRSNNGSAKTVDYWLAKGEMPPASEHQLRRDYVNAKMAKSKASNMFSDNPIA